MKDAIYIWLAGLLSFDDIRRVLTSVLARTTVRNVVARTEEGRFILDTADRIITWSIIGKGVWEPNESRILADVVRAGDMVIDVGANIGWYTVLFANRAGDEGHIFAFEPDPRNFELLEMNATLNAKRNVTLHRVALVEKSGQIRFALNEQNFGDHHVAFDGENLSGPTIEVSGARLDDMVPTGGQIRLIKIDAQGSEPAILRGGVETLRRCECLAIEYWPEGLRRAGFDKDEYLDLLMHGGFTRFRRLREGAAEEFSPVSDLRVDAAGIGRPDDGQNDATDYLLVR